MGLLGYDAGARGNLAVAEAQRIGKRAAQDKAAWWQGLGTSGVVGCVNAFGLYHWGRH